MGSQEQCNGNPQACLDGNLKWIVLASRPWPRLRREKEEGLYAARSEMLKPARTREADKSQYSDDDITRFGNDNFPANNLAEPHRTLLPRVLQE